MAVTNVHWGRVGVVGFWAGAVVLFIIGILVGGEVEYLIDSGEVQRLQAEAHGQAGEVSGAKSRPAPTSTPQLEPPSVKAVEETSKIDTGGTSASPERPCPSPPPLPQTAPPPSAVNSIAQAPPSTATSASKTFLGLDTRPADQWPWHAPAKPPCTTMEDATFGNWQGDTFSPFLCKIFKPDAARIAQCFAGKRIVVLGDSQGVHVTSSWAAMLGCGETLRTGSSCEEGSYFGLPPMERPPELRSNINGRIKDGCARCSACASKLQGCKGGGKLEFITMELAQDHRVISTQYSTTQDNVFRGYMRGENKPDIIIMNCGLHDAGSVPSPAVYAANLNKYVDAAQSTGAQLFWHATTAIKQDNQADEWRQVTSNTKVLVMNKLAADIMHVHDIPVLDAYAVSNFPGLALHSDAMHMHGQGDLYYHTIRDAFTSVYCLHKENEPSGDMPAWWEGGSGGAKRSVTYVGCFQDVWPNPKFGDVTLGWHDNMTPEMCASSCANQHIGLEMGSRCFCLSEGAALSERSIPKVGDDQCSTPCNGDSSLKCGGTGMALSVFRVGGD